MTQTFVKPIQALQTAPVLQYDTVTPTPTHTTHAPCFCRSAPLPASTLASCLETAVSTQTTQAHGAGCRAPAQTASHARCAALLPSAGTQAGQTSGKCGKCGGGVLGAQMGWVPCAIRNSMARTVRCVAAGQSLLRLGQGRGWTACGSGRVNWMDSMWQQESRLDGQHVAAGDGRVGWMDSMWQQESRLDVLHRPAPLQRMPFLKRVTLGELAGFCPGV
eukprot:364172-Chlamydomonas_euryale.AAC.2